MTATQEPRVDDLPSSEKSPVDRAFAHLIEAPRRRSFSAEQYLNRFRRSLEHAQSKLKVTKEHQESKAKAANGATATTTPTAAAATSPGTATANSQKNTEYDDSMPLPQDHHLKDSILQEPIRVQPIRLRTFIAEGAHRYWSDLTHPAWIPGRNLWERVYSLGVLPFLIGFLVVCQWLISAFVWWSSCTRSGQYLYQTFLRYQIHIYDQKNVIDPKGNQEALRLLAKQTHQKQPHFDYHIAHLMLICSSLVYERDEEMVERAFTLLEKIDTEEKRLEAKKLLLRSERSIDERAQKQFGMRFMGISELKTRGGPFAGLFYNDDYIILVYKGTSVLAFHEYLVDTTIYRVHADEYLYGEVHKGFYESLFPDPEPRDDYERRHFDATNPFATIMDSIIHIATQAKARTGKPLNLWITGHSLGGALAAMSLARLQKPLQANDPLLKDHPGFHGANQKEIPEGWTVWDETMARAVQRQQKSSSSPLSRLLDSLGGDDTDDKDTLLHLRDCYSFASPRMCDSDFSVEFHRNEAAFRKRSPFKPTYWRIVADMDIVPMMPPGCSSDTDNVNREDSKCESCRRSLLHGHHDHKSQQQEEEQNGSRPKRDRLLSTVSEQTLNNDDTDNDSDSNGSTTSIESSSSSFPFSISSKGIHRRHHRQDDQARSDADHDSKSDTTTTSDSTGPKGDQKHLRPYKSLLDYTHVGQLVRVSQFQIPPVVKPSRPHTEDLKELVVRSPLEVYAFLSRLRRHPEIAEQCASIGRKRGHHGDDVNAGKKETHVTKQQEQTAEGAFSTSTATTTSSYYATSATSTTSTTSIRSTRTTHFSSTEEGTAHMTSTSTSSTSSSSTSSSSSSSSSSFSMASVSTLQVLVSLRPSNIKRTVCNAMGWNNTENEPQTLDEWHDALLQDLVYPASLEAYQPQQIAQQQEQALMAQLEQQQQYECQQQEQQKSSWMTRLFSSSHSDTATMTTTTTSSSSASCQTQQQTKYSAKEQLTMFDRLRKPCDAEQVMLSFPGIFAHAPANYERNLVRARFYFKTFSGHAYGKMAEEHSVAAGATEEEEDDKVNVKNLVWRYFHRGAAQEE